MEKFSEKYNNLKDNRVVTWSNLEKDAQERAPNKDSNFKLEGTWKKFFGNQDGYKIYIVDGEWVRNNLSLLFGHGGHGYVHEFIPNDEIWISDKHFLSDGNECCKGSHPGEKFTINFTKSTILHEITENKEMRNGKTYLISHNIALDAEREAGFLDDSLI